MRTNPIYLGALAALFGLAGCGDPIGPSYADLEIILDWPRLDEEEFVGHDFSFESCRWVVVDDNLETECETLAEGAIPADGVIHARVACPFPVGSRFFVRGYYEARGIGGHCLGSLSGVECTDRPQVLPVAENPAYHASCSPPE